MNARTKQAGHPMTMVEILDTIRARHNIPSDRQLGRLMGLSTASVSQLRRGFYVLDDSTALRVAELLDLDPQFVFACNRAAGAKTPGVKKVWEELARRLAGGLLAVAAIAIALRIRVKKVNYRLREAARWYASNASAISVL